MKILLYLSLLPSIILGFYIYNKDKVEKEPTSLLLKCFIGGIISALLVLLLSYIGLNYEPNKDNFISMLYYTFFVVGIVEEFSKFIFTYLITYKNKNFDYLYDSVVYSSFVSLGFGILEGILYILVTNDIYVALIRGFTTIPAHIFFGIFMGYYLGFAKQADIKKQSREKDNNLCFALIIPALLHGMYDYCLFTENNISILIFICFVLYLYIASFKRIDELSDIKKSMYEE